MGSASTSSSINLAGQEDPEFTELKDYLVEVHDPSIMCTPGEMTEILIGRVAKFFADRGYDVKREAVVSKSGSHREWRSAPPEGTTRSSRSATRWPARGGGGQDAQGLLPQEAPLREGQRLRCPLDPLWLAPLRRAALEVVTNGATQCSRRAERVHERCRRCGSATSRIWVVSRAAVTRSRDAEDPHGQVPQADQEEADRPLPPSWLGDPGRFIPPRALGSPRGLLR